MHRRNTTAPTIFSILLGTILFLIATSSSALSQAKNSRVTFFKSENSHGNDVVLYIDGNYVGSLSSTLESYEFNCSQPPSYLPTVELPAGTHYLRYRYRGADYGPYAFTLNENVCMKYQIYLPSPQQTYYEDSDYSEDDEAWDIILYLIMIGSIVYLISLI